MSPHPTSHSWSHIVDGGGGPFIRAMASWLADAVVETGLPPPLLPQLLPLTSWSWSLTVPPSHLVRLCPHSPPSPPPPPVIPRCSSPQHIGASPLRRVGPSASPQHIGASPLRRVAPSAVLPPWAAILPSSAHRYFPLGSGAPSGGAPTLGTSIIPPSVGTSVLPPWPRRPQFSPSRPLSVPPLNISVLPHSTVVLPPWCIDALPPSAVPRPLHITDLKPS